MTAATRTVHEICTLAALHIEVFGHHQGDFLGDDWPTLQNLAACCAAGAIRLGAGMSADDIMRKGEWPAVVIEADELLAEYLIEASWRECRNRAGELDPVETIAGWNDADGMDAEEVARVLREVAEEAR